MTTWNKSAKNKLDKFAKGIESSFDGGVFTAYFSEISACVRNSQPEHIGHWVNCIGYEAARGLEELGLWDADKLLEVLVSKQKDYGHGNILSFGIVGVGIRACDKIARYYNLKDRPDSAQNEPFIDCLMDMVGYAVIGSMLEDDTFVLELE
jgi:hypothetical protein